MKKITLSVVALGLIASANAAEDLSTMFSEGKASGQIREFSVDREYQGSSWGNAGKEPTHRKANAIGGHLKFETGDYKGLTLGTAFYTTNGFLMPTADYDTNGNQTYTKQDQTLLGKDNENLTFIGELYFNYKYENTNFKAGRQTLETPMAGGDDARMIRNLFEAYILTNTDVEDTTIMAGHITRFSQGTFGRVYDAAANNPNSLLAATSGYSAVNTRDYVGDFTNMGTYAVGKSTAGVSVASVTYTGVENLKLQLWDYYAHDLMNIVYAQADYSWTCMLNDNIKPYVAAQFIKEDNVGDDLAGDVNGMYWGAKLGAKVENFNAYVAYSQTSENDASDIANGKIGTANAIVTPWGGMPAFTQGMVTRHMFLAGTKAAKIAASYNWKSFGPDLATSVYYTSFDMHEYSGYGIARTATEPGFDVQYKPELVKNLNIRVRGNFPRSYAESTATSGNTGWSEYRLIVNYTF